jgi:thymidylate synthase (FAD)
MSEVNLIALSKPSAITDCKTAADLIAYTARVSNPANQNNTATAPKLLRYLIREQHWSPFEMVHMTMEIKTTRDIARQILRHRSFSFQEFSQRYADPTQDLDFIHREARLQDTKNRQNSVETDDKDLLEKWNMHQSKTINAAYKAYEWAIENGIAKEQARAVLPEGNTESVLYMSGTLRSWIHYCELRRGNGTQKEHSLIADKCWEIIGVHFPDIVEALND